MRVISIVLTWHVSYAWSDLFIITSVPNHNLFWEPFPDEHHVMNYLDISVIVICLYFFALVDTSLPKSYRRDVQDSLNVTREDSIYRTRHSLQNWKEKEIQGDQERKMGWLCRKGKESIDLRNSKGSTKWGNLIVSVC